MAARRRAQEDAIIGPGPDGAGAGPPAHHRNPGSGRLRGRLSVGGRRWQVSTQPVQLVDAPVEIARSTRRWLRGSAVDPDRAAGGDYHTVVADQVRELVSVLRRTTAGMEAIVDLMLATAIAPGSATEPHTVTIDLTGRQHGARATADILATIDHLAMAGDSARLATPAEPRSLIGWIADEIDAQAAGHPPTSYATTRPLRALPCPLLRATDAHDLGQVTVHAYRHGGLSARQVAAVRRSRAAVILAASPGTTLDELLSRFAATRLDLLAELGQLIELGAVFGIDHRWYPYDITLLALLDGRGRQAPCRCPSVSDVER